MDTPNVDLCIRVVRQGITILRGGAVARDAEAELKTLRAKAAAGEVLFALMEKYHRDELGDLGFGQALFDYRRALSRPEETKHADVS